MLKLAKFDELIGSLEELLAITSLSHKKSPKALPSGDFYVCMNQVSITACY